MHVRKRKAKRGGVRDELAPVWNPLPKIVRNQRFIHMGAGDNLDFSQVADLPSASGVSPKT